MAEKRKREQVPKDELVPAGEEGEGARDVGGGPVLMYSVGMILTEQDLSSNCPSTADAQGPRIQEHSEMDLHHSGSC